MRPRQPPFLVVFTIALLIGVVTGFMVNATGLWLFPLWNP